MAVQDVVWPGDSHEVGVHATGYGSRVDAEETEFLVPDPFGGRVPLEFGLGFAVGCLDGLRFLRLLGREFTPRTVGAVHGRAPLFRLVFPTGRAAPASPGPSIRSLGTVPPAKTPEMGADGYRRPSSAPAGLKPAADPIRKVSPFGSPKREGQRPNEAKRGRRRVVQVDPSHGGTDARVPRRGRWRGSVAAPASRVHGRPGIAGLHPAADRASRGPLNGFPGALAGVLRHRIGGGRRRLSDTSSTGLSEDAKGVKPAYPPWPRFARPRRELAGGCAPSDPHIANGAS